MDSFDDENEIPNFKETAIWQKAMDIAVLTHKIAELIDETDEEFPLGAMKGVFRESAMTIRPNLRRGKNSTICAKMHFFDSEIVILFRQKS